MVTGERDGGVGRRARRCGALRIGRESAGDEQVSCGAEPGEWVAAAHRHARRFCSLNIAVRPSVRILLWERKKKRPGLR